MKDQFKITVEADAPTASERVLAAVKDLANKAESEHGIDVTVRRVDSFDGCEAGYRPGGEYVD